MSRYKGPRVATSMCLFFGLSVWGAFARSRQPTAQTYTFNNVRIVAGGFITGIVAHPLERGLFYARTDIGGAYRWDATKQIWNSITDATSPANWNLGGTASIAIDPTNPSVVYLAEGTYTQSWASNAAIYKSSNQGANFTVVNLPIQLGSNEDGRYSGERLAVVPWATNVLYLGTPKNGLWRSTDYASSWSQVSSFPVTGPTADNVGVNFVMFGPPVNHSPYSTIYVGVSDLTTGLYQSVDNGNSWQPMAGQPTGNLPTNATLSSNGNLYVTYSKYPGPNSSDTGRVWKYNTATGAWTDITPINVWGSAVNFGFAKVVVDPQSPDTVMASTEDRYYPGEEIYRSRDAGAHWVALGAEPDTGKNYSSFDVSVSPWLLFGGVTPTNNMGNWIGAMAIDPFDSNHFFYGTGQTMYTTNQLTNVDSLSTIHWTVGGWGIEETAVLALASPPSGAHLLSALGDIGGFRHDDLTVSPPQGQFYTPQLWTNSSIDFAQANPNLIARVGSPAYGQTLCGGYSIDQGTTWTAFTNAAGCQNGPGTIAVAADGSRFVWAPTGGATVYSTNNGATWMTSSGAPSGQPVVADRKNARKFYTFNQNAGTFYVSNDGGATFAAAATGLPTGSFKQVTTGFGGEGDIWLSLNWNGLYHSTNSGATFSYVASAQQAYSVGLGMAAMGTSYPALFLFGMVNNVESIFRSDNGGASWLRIADDQHQYANLTLVTGDPRIYGRVYIGANGRGIIYGDIAH